MSKTDATQKLLRIALAIPRLGTKRLRAEVELRRYASRYGCTQTIAHRRRISDYLRADSAFCRAYNAVAQSAGMTW